MPLDLENRRVTVLVNIGGNEIEVYAEMPDNDEILQYRRDLVGKKGRLDPAHITKVQIKWGLRKMVGIREGDILVGGKPLEIDPEGRWKEVIREKGAVIAQAVAQALFETPQAEIVEEEAPLA